MEEGVGGAEVSSLSVGFGCFVMRDEYGIDGYFVYVTGVNLYEHGLAQGYTRYQGYFHGGIE